jgi:hypothetical protein
VCGLPFQIRPVIDYLQKRFELYELSANLTIDEVMCPFRGCWQGRVYMKNKPNKWGAWLDCVCDAQNGFLCNFIVYAGAEREQDPVTGDVKKKPSKRVNDLVKELLANYANRNHRVFMDRRFGSPHLFRELLLLGF